MHDYQVNRDQGESDLEFFAPRLAKEIHALGEAPGEIVACASCRMVFYAVVETPVGAKACICPYHWTSSYYHARNNFNYTIVWEGEYVSRAWCKCPARLLDLLSPAAQLLPDGPARQRALDWRKDCRTRVAVLAAKPRVHKGDIVVFDQPLCFRSGEKHARLVFESHSTFHIEGGRGRYLIHNWRERDWTVISRAEVEQEDASLGLVIDTLLGD